MNETKCPTDLARLIQRTKIFAEATNPGWESTVKNPQAKAATGCPVQQFVRETGEEGRAASIRGYQAINKQWKVSPHMEDHLAMSL